MSQIPDAAVQDAAKAIRRAGDTYTEMATAALTSALPHLPLGYEVKQLEWGELRHTDDYSFAQDAETSIGKYIATDTGWFLLGQTGWINEDSIEKAQAAAQADFERRVRECHVAKPIDVAAVRG